MRSGRLMLICFTFLFACTGRAQESGSSKAPTIEELKTEVARLRHEIDSLKTLRKTDLLTQSDMQDRLEESLEKRLAYLETKIDAVSRATAPVAFNPGMTAFINFAARGDSRKVYDQADPSNEISNRPFLRTVEMELLGAVDPYASAVAVISLENEAGKDFGIDAEEAYGLLKRIPILEEAPLGMKVKNNRHYGKEYCGASRKLRPKPVSWLKLHGKRLAARLFQTMTMRKS